MKSIIKGTRREGGGAAGLALMFTATAFARQPAHIRGQIEKADGAMLALSEV